MGKILVWLARVVVDLSGWPLARPILRDRARQLPGIFKIYPTLGCLLLASTMPGVDLAVGF